MSSLRASSDVLFRVAGGPRVGFGHVLRSLSLARALRVTPRLSLRGSQSTEQTARDLGARVERCRSPRDLDPARTGVLVVDDPSARAARPWVRAARARGIRAVSVHDLGLAPVDSDLAVDGSVTPGLHRTARRALLGLRYAVLDPRLVPLRASRRIATSRRSGGAKSEVCRVVVSLGGGTRVELALRLAREIRAAVPAADVLLAGGFVAPPADGGADVAWIEPRAFRRELARATAAVLAGGVSLYEACALGIPTIALSVVPGQIATVRAFARLGAAIDAGRAVASEPASVRRVSRRVGRAAAMLLARPDVRRTLSGRAIAQVDGRGARRVAKAIRALGHEIEAGC